MSFSYTNASGVRPLSAFSSIFSETTGPIQLKFHMETPYGGGMEVCTKVPGHMTKMATMSWSSLKQRSSLIWVHIVCNIGYLRTKQTNEADDKRCDWWA